MTNEYIDIVIPIWNRPVETRACLVNLIENTAHARLLLVDNSSDRETERMLEEFAEALDVRVLYLKNSVNEGFVRAVNRGLSRAESSFVAVVRQSSLVGPHWLEPLLDFMNEVPDSGIVVPALREKGSSARKRQLYRGMEMASSDFAALLMRRSLLGSVGMFNEELDGGEWCLKDYARRLWKAGYRTNIVPEGVVDKGEEVTLGSTARRAEHEQRIIANFRKTWGEEQAFCIQIPKGSDLGDMHDRFKLIVTAARQGNRVLIIPHPSIASELVRSGGDRLHEYVTVVSLPRIMAQRSARKALFDYSMLHSNVTHVAWDNGGCFTGTADSIPFADLEKIVTDNESRYYNRDAIL